MFEKQALKLLIEIEELQKQLRSWKKTPTKLIKEENKLYQKLRALIRKKNKEIMSEFKKLDRVPSSDMEMKILIAPIAEAKREYSDIVMENTQESIRAGMERTKTELKRQGLGKGKNSNLMFYLNGSLKLVSPELDFEEFSQEVSDRIRQDSFIASGQTIDRMSGNVMDNIKDSYEAGYGIDKAAINLQDVFDDMEDWELKRVARTEINGAQNLGAEATMRQMGIIYDKWRTAGDARVRGVRPEDTADHTYLDGQISYVSGNFSNGLSRPGDRSGPIKEWIQCRCVLLPYLIPEGYAAPSMSFFYESDLVAIETPGLKSKPKPTPKPKPRIRPTTGKPVRVGSDVRTELNILQKKTKKDILMHEKRIKEYNNILGKLDAIKPDPGPNWDDPLYLEWQKKYSVALNNRFNERMKIANITGDIKDKFKEYTYVNKEGFTIKKDLSYEFDIRGLKNTNGGLKEFSKLVDEELWSDRVRFVVERKRRGRSFFDNKLSIHISNTDSKGVIIHETAHYMERYSPGMHKKIMTFYDKRTKGCPLEWLGEGYGRNEMTRKDKFISAYMGKDYGGEASEILSMGMEMMYHDPVKFATQDPEMFDFIYNLLRGTI